MIEFGCVVYGSLDVGSSNLFVKCGAITDFISMVRRGDRSRITGWEGGE